MKKLTPKETVKMKYPLAYSIAYELLTCVYQEPVKAMPRGSERRAIILGMGRSYMEAWSHAAARIRKVTPND